MIPIEMKTLFGKLNPLCLKTLSEAVGLCNARRNDYVEITHWLVKLLEAPDSDLTRLAKQYNVDPSKLLRELNRAIDQLRRYVEVLQVWNRKLALVASDDPTVVLQKHVADSLFAAAHCSGSGAVVDLGSGAGFPGLVIAIVHPTARVTLVEARGKKVSFLEEACRAAGIRNAEPIHGRIETVATESRHRAAYEVVTSRALADLDVLQALAKPFAREKGRLLAMRAAMAPAPAEAARFDYTLPDGTPRTLLSIDL
mgnify:CR=1 FL=1